MVRLLLAAGLLLMGACAHPAPSTSASQTADALEEVTLLDGSTSAWPDLIGAQAQTLVVFATVWCEACAREWPQVQAWARARPGLQLVYVVSGSDAAQVRAWAEARGASASVRVVLDPDGRVARHFDVRATPTLFHFRGSRRRGPLRALDEVPTSGVRWVPVEDRGTELGTSYHVVVLARSDEVAPAREHLGRVRAEVRTLEARLSEWRPSSEISGVNRLAGTQTVTVSEDLREILEGGLHVAAATDGAFDPTWATWQALWEDAERAQAWPSAAALAALRPAVGFRNVTLQAGHLSLAHAQTRLGIAGLAKGWLIDRVFRSLRSFGYEHVIVNIGGDVRTSGRDRAGRVRRFELVDPYRPPAIAASVPLADVAFATSGNYLRRRTIAGREVGHILDPRTGLPPAFDGSVTAITRDAAMADALATALFVMGPDAGLAYARAHDGLEAIYVTRAGVRSTMPDR